MALTDYAEKKLDQINPPKAPKVPDDVIAKIKRGRERLQQVSPPRREAAEFTNNNHYVSLSKDGLKLNQQSTVNVSQGGDKPDHRVRRSRDLIGPIVQGKISAATKRIPKYETIPSSPDSEDWNAARLSEKIAKAGHDLWGYRNAFRKGVWHALVTDEAFFMPYWDSTVGPFLDVSEHPEDPEQNDPENPSYVGMGEIKIGVWGGLEVGWEPGIEFEDSRWWFIEHVRPADVLESEDGFIGGKLESDAATLTKTNKKQVEAGSKLVMVTEYIERPCPKYPRGRRLVFANERLVFPEEDYPLTDHKGEIVDEPCIHRVTYRVDGSSDRGRGLVRSLIESMRQYDHVWNKAAEWIQIALIPQMTAPEGAVKTPLTDEPALLVEYDPIMAGQNGKPEWRDVPQIPQELFQVADRAQAEMGFIAHENQIPIQDAESGKQAATLISKDLVAWEDFIENLADVYARCMRDSLTIAQLRYTDERLVNFRGRTGWESIADFKGADLRGQTDVRVPPGSLEARTRLQNEQRIQNIASMFPGYFSPEVLLSALEGGSAEKLIEGYEDDVARANRVIAQIRAGTFFEATPRPVFPGEEAQMLEPTTGEPIFNEQTGEPEMETELPGWMPRPFDNISVHKSVMETWLKGDDWDQLEPPAKKASLVYYNALLDMEARKAQRDAELQGQMAEEQGMSNAAKPQSKPMPSLPSVEEG